MKNPARLNIIVKKILIIILFSSIPEARYEKNIIKNSISSSPPEKTYGKGRNLSPGGSLRMSPGTRIMHKFLPVGTAS